MSRGVWLIFVCALLLGVGCQKETPSTASPDASSAPSAPQTSGVSDVEEALAEAKGLFEQRYWSATIERAESVLESEPDNAVALELRKKARRHRKQLKKLQDAHAFFDARNYDKAELWAGSIPDDSPYVKKRDVLLKVMIHHARVLPEEIDRKGGMKMRRVVVGAFIQGSDVAGQDAAFELCQKHLSGECKREWFNREGPKREHFLNSFYIDEAEVTVRHYERCVNEAGCEAVKWDDCLPDGESSYDFLNTSFPQVCVSWSQANAYCAWAEARLPTEAEWEKAAQGPLGLRYPWGDEWEVDKANGAGDLDGYHRLAPSRAFDPNGFGLYDISGNAMEWTADWFDSNYYTNAPFEGPQGPTRSPRKARTVRGGSFMHTPDALRTHARNWMTPSRLSREVGFRCAAHVLGK